MNTFYWGRDNLDHFIVHRGDEVVGYLTCGWGECKFESSEGPLASRTMAKIKKYCTNGDYVKDNGDGTLTSPSPQQKFKVPGTKLVIEFYEDDCCY